MNKDTGKPVEKQIVVNGEVQQREIYISRKDEYEARKGIYEEGVRVKHKIHGYGVIQELRENGSVLVVFDKRGSRTLGKVDGLTIIGNGEEESDDSEDHT